jgi:hypothetical protein
MKIDYDQVASDRIRQTARSATVDFAPLVVHQGWARSDRSPLHDVTEPAGPVGHGETGFHFHGRILTSPGRRPVRLLVEPDGIEPTTSCLQSRRSPN